MRYAVLAVAVLAGCAAPLTPQQRADQFEAHLNRMAATYGPACERVYQRSSPEWGRCVATLAEKDEARDRDRREGMARALERAGDAYRTQPPAAQQTRFCQWIGNVWTCN